MRRRVFLNAATALAVWSSTAHAQGSPPAWLRGGISRDSSGGLVSVFGLDPDLAADVLRPATRDIALPDGYAPADLVAATRAGITSAGTQLIRRVIVDDTSALADAARAEGVDVYVGSGFRSQAYQVAVFAAQVARWGSADAANRYSAQPGHSQHQLGTTIDFTDNFRAFRESSAAAWLQARAQEFGFVLPYTDASQDLTGYVPEPWHARWVGRPLAIALQAAAYQTWTEACADDALAQITALMTG
jgi:zinc D-Ala-D-Ala carboxypeptidase